MEIFRMNFDRAYQTLSNLIINYRKCLLYAKKKYELKIFIGVSVPAVVDDCSNRQYIFFH